MPETPLSELRNIRLIIAYDGTDFSGWQRQDGTRTVQGVIEAALAKLHKHPVKLSGSGRTDSGVHARAQVANFHTTIQRMEAARFVPALNSLLPKDVRIMEASQTSPDFHARFSARLRTYRYFFITEKTANPWELRYAWHLRRHVDMPLLADYARLFRGEMDCTSFAAAADKSKSRFRYIKNAHFFIEGNRLTFEISANAFLWNMVRSIVGTLIQCEEHGASERTVQDIIEGRKRSLAGPTAPPEGLFLWQIEF